MSPLASHFRGGADCLVFSLVTAPLHRGGGDTQIFSFALMWAISPNILNTVLSSWRIPVGLLNFPTTFAPPTLMTVTEYTILCPLNDSRVECDVGPSMTNTERVTAMQFAYPRRCFLAFFSLVKTRI